MTRLAPDHLVRNALHRRAVEAVVWGMPAVNTDRMYQAMAREVKGGWNQIVYWSRLLDWKNQTLTPNPDVIYLMPFFNTKDAGPMVLEIPPADDGVINGTIMDAWQVPLEDVGPAGVDKGKGGKYLILPPDPQGAAPKGYIALPSANYQGYALLRSILRSGSDVDVAKAVDYAKRIKSIPCRRQRIRRRRHSSTRSTAFTIPRSRTTCVSSSRSTASCRLSPGCHATS